MPGFGSGPFGSGPFGEYAWGKSVLFGLAPEPYRDADVDGLLEAYAEGQAESFDALRRKIRDFGELRDPLRVRAKDDVSTLLRLGPKLRVLGEIEQSGIAAKIVSGGGLVTESGRFTFSDIGKLVFIDRSSIGGNNRSTTIVGVVSPTTIVTSPSLSVDSGPLRWTVRAVEDENPDEVDYEIASGSVQDITLGYLLTDGFSEVTIAGRRLFPDVTVDRNLYTEREGNDGFFDGSAHFRSATAAFTQNDVGKKLVVVGSVRPENSARFEITEVVGVDEVVLDSDEITSGDVGPLTWAIMHRSQLRLESDPVLRGTVEQYGSDAELSGSDIITSPTADFTAADIGKLVTIRATGSVHNGTYEILSVNSRVSVTVDAAFAVDLSVFVWEVRAATLIGDGTQVEVKAFPLLPLLATDFGIEVDNDESEEFQRRWVASVSRWIPLKGNKDGYAFLGALTGFDLTATPLFRISQEVYDVLDPSVTLAVGENLAGRFGEDGELFLQSGRSRFRATSAIFTDLDVGLSIEVSGSGLGNDGLRMIETVVSGTEVEFREVDTATAETDLTWRIVRLYGTEPPALPVYDEINADLMTDLKGSSAFSVDKYCFEPDFDTSIGVGGDGVFVITSVNPSVASPVPVAITVRAYGDVNVVTGLGEGRWRITDAGNVTYFVETIPVENLEVAGGRTGSDGTFPGGNTFTSASAAFTSSDVGRQLRITGSGSGNDALFRIDAYVSPTEVTLDLTPLLPDANSGALEWSVVFWTFEVVATTPPALGAGTLEYECPQSELSCDYCHSYKVLISGTTSLVMDDPYGRLIDRLDQGKPAHVAYVMDVGFVSTAVVEISATVTTP